MSLTRILAAGLTLSALAGACSSADDTTVASTTRPPATTTTSGGAAPAGLGAPAAVVAAADEWPLPGQDSANSRRGAQSAINAADVGDPTTAGRGPSSRRR